MDLSHLNRLPSGEFQQVQEGCLVRTGVLNALQSTGLISQPGSEGVNQPRNLFEFAELEERDRANPLLVEHWRGQA